MKQKAIIAIKRLLGLLAGVAGYEVIVRKKPTGTGREGLNLNIGCGQYTISGFDSLDIYTDHYHKTDHRTFIEYDIRKDDLPYDDDSVNNIYCSHVIEHIETQHVERFFQEIHRVLKKWGVLRIVCPDAEFLWQVSTFENDYWLWREPWFRGPMSIPHHNTKPEQRDFFTREIATPRSRFYRHRISDPTAKMNSMEWKDYREVCQSLTGSLTFRIDHPGDHINYWDFERLTSIGQKSGFTKIIRSKPGASVSKTMQRNDMDQTRPNMSLYVEFVK